MLPGPAAFVARVCGAIGRDRFNLLHAPFNALALADALEQHLEERGYGCVRVDLQDGAAFGPALADQVGLADASPAALATARALADAAVLVRLRGRAPEDLVTFARLVRRPSQTAGASLVIISEDGDCRLEGHRAERVRGAFAPLDSAAYAASMPRHPRPLEARLCASIAIEVAAWDVELLDLLGALPIDQAVRPDLHVDNWDDGRCQRWRAAPLEWEHGCLDDWGGEPTEHPLWLASNRPEALKKRVWQGQLAALLPWIEQHRLRLVEREGKRLRPDPDRSGPDIESLDWGPLVVQLHSATAEVRRLLQTFRAARNELAHARPLTWGQVKACIDAAAAYGPRR